MIRTAKQNEAMALTRISFDSKKYWNYPEEYFEIWKNELTITPGYIEKNDVYVYEADNAVVGYYSIVYLHEDINISGITIGKGFWLEHMFVEPSHIGKGIGAKMFQHVQTQCKKECVNVVGILADPNARGFYERMGCQYVGEYPSTIEKRTTPYLIFRF